MRTPWTRIVIVLLLMAISGSVASAQNARAQAEAELVKARELLKQGYFDSAVVSYQKAFEIDPTYKQAYEELGELMLEKRNYSYAIRMYEKLAVLDPGNPKWDRILFDLYDSYEMSDEAIKSGERLIKQGDASQETLQKLAKLYKDTNRTSDRVRIMELYDQGAVDAAYWEELHRLYTELGRHDEAAEAARQALALDPNSQKYKTALALSYIDSRQLDKAEAIFNEMLEKNPDDPGLKGHMARLYSAEGDRYLENERGNTALTYYEKAEALTKQEGVAEPEAIAPSFQSQRRSFQNLRVSALSGSLQERKRLAELLLRPSLDSNNDFGKQADNDFFRSINTIRVPIRGTELDLRVRQAHFDVSSAVGDATADFLYAGFRYNINRNWHMEAYGAPFGLYDLEFHTQSDNFSGGVRRYRKLWTWTPLAIAQDLKYDGTGGYFDWAFHDRWSLAGDLDVQNFEDGVDQTIYNIGPTYLLINDPGKRTWGLSYVYSGQSNSRPVNPNLRFAPRALNANTVGTEYSHIVNDRFRYRLGAFHSWINDGTTAVNFLVGTDVQLWEGSFLGLEYNQGALQQGAIPNTIQTVDNDNYNVRADLRLTF